MTSPLDPAKTAPAAPAPAPTGAPPAPSFNPHDLMKLYLARQFDELSDKFLALLAHFEQANYVTLSRPDQYFVNAFVKHFLHLFTQPEDRRHPELVRPILSFVTLPVNLRHIVRTFPYGYH